MSPAAALAVPVSPLAAGPDEPALSPDTFRRLAALLRAEAGIHLPDAKAQLVVSRLVRRLRALGLADFETYASLVSGADAGEERRLMVEALTTNHTFFEREPHHFEHLRGEVLPRLAARARAGGRVRIWSAGCSSGQEPYSIALSVLRLVPEAHALDLRILATDIDRNVLAVARAGRYDAAALRDVAPADRDRGFRCQDGGAAFAARPELRALIRFRELNLLDPWPMRKAFDAVFFRNVAIYFDQDVREALWARMAGQIAPGGWLYAGHSERLTGPAAADFAHRGITTYRRLEA